MSRKRILSQDSRKTSALLMGQTSSSAQKAHNVRRLRYSSRVDNKILAWPHLNISAQLEKDVLTAFVTGIAFNVVPIESPVPALSFSRPPGIDALARIRAIHT